MSSRHPTVVPMGDSRLDALTGTTAKLSVPVFRPIIITPPSGCVSASWPMLTAGANVVMDFPANTVENRKWMLGIVQEADVAHTLHVLDVPDEICKARLRKRNENSEHPFEVSDEQFAQISRHFVLTSADEGFEIEVHRFQQDG